MHKNETTAPKKRAWALSAGLLVPTMIGMSANAQLLESARTNWGTNRVFSYSVTTTYGTNISIEASPNVITKAEAILNIKEDSVIQNTAGDIGGETGATIVTTPTGTTANLTGITVNNNFILDEGTSFYTSAESGEQNGEAQRANVTATANHSVTVSITNNENSFYNTLRENFEGAQ